MLRKASLKDVPNIRKLVNRCASGGTVLPVGIYDVYESTRDFTVYEEDRRVVGVCSLKIVWEDLAELRSLCVEENYRGKAIGSQLVNAILLEAKELELKKVFALTTSPVFFSKLKFTEIDKGTLPHKIWHDCVKCIKFPNCDEVAMIHHI